MRQAGGAVAERLFWTGLILSLVAPLVVPWWIFTRNPISAGEVGSRERIITYGITDYSAVQVVQRLLLCALPGIMIAFAAELFGGFCVSDLVFVVVFPLAWALLQAAIWLEVRRSNLKGVNPI